MRSGLTTGAVLAASLLLLGWNVWNAGLASGFLDPVAQIGAQDEAVYAHTSLRMARGEDPLTPRFFGRPALYKPPLLYWLTAASVRCLGVSGLSLRLASLLAAALGCALVFLWLRGIDSAFAGIVAVALMLSSHLWHSLARYCLTDMILAACITAAAFALARDPELQTRGSFYGFAAATAAALLDKAIAGLLPILLLLLYVLIAPGGRRPPLRRMAALGLWIALLALPWYVYQLTVHTRWFWAEYVLNETLGWGLGQPVQTTAEGPLFYPRRLLLFDPVLLLAGLAAIPGWIAALRRRDSHQPFLLAAWVAVVLAAVSIFHYRNAAYLLPLVPAMALISSTYGPLTRGILRRLALPALVLLFVLKAATPDRAWGLDYRSGTSIADAPLLDDYAHRHRPRELILVNPRDQYYSAVLPLPRVRYCFVGASEASVQYIPDFRYLGIMVTAEQFSDLERWRPIFRARLREWGVESGEAIATVILARDQTELDGLLKAFPGTDFLLPSGLWRLASP